MFLPKYFKINKEIKNKWTNKKGYITFNKLGNEVRAMILEFKNVEKSFGNKKVLKGVSFTAKKWGG